MTTKRPSLKERVFEKLQGTRSRSSSEDLSKTGSDSDSGGNRHSHTIWYAHPQDSSENSSSQQARYKTDNLQSEKGSPELSVELDCSHSSENNKLDKSKRKSQPPGTTDYIVKEWDTLESIAAFYDLTPSELIKLNRLSTRYIYPGQNLFVPSPEYGEETQDPVLDSHDENPPIEKPKMDIPIVRMADKPPAKVPGHVERIASPLSSPKHEPTDIPQKLSEEEASQLDQECHERFIKVNVKHITDGQGVVSGVLLVTPNAVMFDPNVSDPLVLEHGAEQYGVIAPMDMVVSAAMYHDIAAMKVRGQSRNHDDNTPRPEVYHDTACPLYKTWCEGHHKGQNNPAPSHPQTTVHDKHLSREDSVCSCGPSQVSPKLQRYHVTDSKTLSSDSADNSKLSHIMSEIITDTAKTNEVVDDSSSSHDFGDFVSAEPVCRDVVDSHSKWTDILSCQEKSSEISVPPTSVSSEEDKTSQEVEKSSEELRIGNIVYLPYQKNDQGEISVEDVENAKETLQKMSIDEDFLQKDRSVSTPIDIHSSDSLKQASASPEQKTGSFGSFNVTPHLNAFVNYATGLFKLSDIKDIAEARQNEPEISKPSEKSSGVSQLVHKKIASLTHISDTKDLEVAVENAVKLSDKPELFQSFDKLIPRPATTFEDPPLYLCLRLGKPINKNISQTCPIQAYSKRKKKPEYWFSIPRDKVDQLYAFFVQWKPEIYGDEEDVSAENRGFVVLDDEAMPGDMEIHEDYFNSTLQKDWEIISSEEALRRKSVDIDESLLLPELIGESTILQDFHIQMINKHMPARTIGYPWTLNYSTDQHGFSLKTLYRDMYKQDSPVLLIVKDTRDNIFGALTSCELKQSDHFYGTGESFLFTFWPEFKVFRWTGDNSLFIKGSPESLAIGAGQGMFGLWLDGDLYHGRTNRCETYDNDVLTESEDFVVKAFEAWIFNQD